MTERHWQHVPDDADVGVGGAGPTREAAYTSTSTTTRKGRHRGTPCAWWRWWKRGRRSTENYKSITRFVISACHSGVGRSLSRDSITAIPALSKASRIIFSQ